jgi:dCMP deaminase
MKNKFIDYYMGIAELTSKLSYAVRLKVGAVAVKDHKILGAGYNGMPAGWDNNCETIEWCSAGGWLDHEEIIEHWPYEGTYLDSDGYEMKGRYRLKTKPEVLHAEMNCLMKITRSTESSAGATLFCTHAPCIDCAKAIYQAGISHVYYREQYRNDEGLMFLEKSNINVTRHTTT